MTRTLIVAFLTAAAVGLCRPGVAQDEASKDSAQAQQPGSEASIEALTERVSKSVVAITSSGRDGRHSAVGTGFVISPDGLIATNYHVVGQGRDMRVQLPSGRRLEPTALHAFDRQRDLAILRVDAKDLPALELGDADEVKQGQSVLALGNPAGLKYSVVTGVVSAVRQIDGRTMIQVAIPIEPGNSGGPLVDLDGRVLGILSMKSLVTPNLGFAVSINLLKPLLEKPNPILMSRWLTIGALDPREWKPIFGAQWRQRAGRITVEGPGDGFGGRSLCLWQMDVPDAPLDVAVAVQLGDESGAAGLAFGSDGDQRHFGFYPSNGRLRLTRFDGPDVRSWTILHNQSDRNYVAGEFNTLRVHLEGDKASCFVNGEKVVELPHLHLAGAKLGLVKFRNTRAQFKNFRVGRDLDYGAVSDEEAQRIAELVKDISPKGTLNRELVEALAVDADSAGRVLRERATSLDRKAQRLRELAQAAHEHRVIEDLKAALDVPEEKIDLFRAGLLVARLDNEEVDVDAYCQEMERMGREVAEMLPEEPSEQEKLDTLRKYMFDENGFHGSRGDYYNRSNSYLNEVLDDREGLPITLAVVYMELARRIGLHVEGVGLPGHFVVRYVPAEGEGQLIDVFERAEPVSLEEAKRRVKNAIEREPTEDELRGTTKRAIIARMLHNLFGLSSGDQASMHRYLNAILAVEPQSAQHRWLRAIVRYQLDDHGGANEDAEWLLAHEPEGIDLGRVREMQRLLETRDEGP